MGLKLFGVFTTLALPEKAAYTDCQSETQILDYCSMLKTHYSSFWCSVDSSFDFCRLAIL
jgi:hypothetical protein